MLPIIANLREKERAEMSHLSFPQQVQVISLLTEGMSLRAVSRFTGVHRSTVMQLLQRVGLACERLHHARMRDLQVGCLELDETWSFVNTKQQNLKPDSPSEYGDCYLWLGMDAAKKVIVSFHLGKRSQEDANQFVRDVRARVLNRPQIVTDAFTPYVSAIAEAFGVNVDYIQLNKYQGEYTDMRGNPDLSQATTNHCERLNLTARTHLRRCTRRSIAFSKKLAAHRAAVSLFVADYNFVKVHAPLRVTPAMEAGLTPSIWSVADLLENALSTPEDVQPPQLPPPPTYPLPGRQFVRRYVGGRGRFR